MCVSLEIYTWELCGTKHEMFIIAKYNTRRHKTNGPIIQLLTKKQNKCIFTKIKRTKN